MQLCYESPPDRVCLEYPEAISFAKIILQLTVMFTHGGFFIRTGVFHGQAIQCAPS